MSAGVDLIASPHRPGRLPRRTTVRKRGAMLPNQLTPHIGAKHFRRVRGMNPATNVTDAVLPPTSTTSRRDEERVEILIHLLPGGVQATTRWLRRPSSRWVRVIAGPMLVGGSFLSILPLFGMWMLPLGVLLMAEDVPPLRRARDHILDRIERHRPHWFSGGEPVHAQEASPPSSASPGSATVCL